VGGAITSQTKPAIRFGCVSEQDLIVHEFVIDICADLPLIDNDSNTVPSIGREWKGDVVQPRVCLQPCRLPAHHEIQTVTAT